MYRHDTTYYGSDILNCINKELGCRFSMDRGGKYIWYKNGSIVYLDLYENNYLGCLEIHRNGSYVDAMYPGVLKVVENDAVLDLNAIVTFLRMGISHE